MKLTIHEDRITLGMAAAAEAGQVLRAALANQASATLVVATGASQLETLASLAADQEIDWRRVRIFHLDEYVGISSQHPASFRRYLEDRFIARLPAAPEAVHWIDGEHAPEEECRRLNALMPPGPFDLLLAGIGENAHIAFNDPPADFNARFPYLVVPLDEACRRQQVGEGWFATLDDVPQRAISMSVPRILLSRTIVCSVPDGRKANAVLQTLEGPITPAVPASILRSHRDCRLHLDRSAAALLPVRREG